MNEKIKAIQEIIAQEYNITLKDLTSKELKTTEVVLPRQIAMYLSRELLNESFERIGLEFGGKDHSSVMYACDKIKEEIQNNDSLKDEIDKIKSNIL